MAITGVYPWPEDEGSEDENGYSFSKKWLVTTDSHATGEYEVLHAPGIPRMGEQHYSGKAKVDSRNADKFQDSDWHWLVTIEYGPLEDENQNTTGPNNGGDSAYRNPTISISSERRTKHSPYDYNGLLLRNSAGDQYQEPDEFDASDMIITFSASLPFEKINEQVIYQWRDVVHGPQFLPKFFGGQRALEQAMAVGANAPKFFGFPAFMPRLLDIGASTEQERTSLISANSGTVTRWTVNIRVSITESWLGSHLDEGFFTNPGFGGNVLSENVSPEDQAANRKRAIDQNSLPSLHPVLLNGKGDKSTGTAWFLFWQRYKHADLNQLFAQLGLPTTIAGYKRINQ